MKSIAQLITEGRELREKDSSWAADWLHRNWPDIEAALEAAEEMRQRVNMDAPWSTMMAATDRWQRRAIQAEAKLRAARELLEAVEEGDADHCCPDGCDGSPHERLRAAAQKLRETQ